MPSILWSALVPPAAKHPHNVMLPPPCFMFGMVFFGLQASPFFLQMMVIMAKQFYFLFHQTRGHFSKKYDLCPHVQLQTIVWLVLMTVLEQWLLLAEWPFRLCQYRTCFTLDIHTLLYLFPPASSHGPLLLFWNWFALFPPTYVHL